MTNAVDPARLEDIAALDLPGPDRAAIEAARARQADLTKPPGSLGRLEELAAFMAGWRGTARPRIDHAQALVFAGNHGICAQGVNPFPQAVTALMVANFEAGGAA
ncbi:MAG: nicotinate-nucleotide--dimethylbenzimidazole phosphoribosyltransferase, partial [Rhodosalinus sp.]